MTDTPRAVLDYLATLTPAELQATLTAARSVPGPRPPQQDEPANLDPAERGLLAKLTSALSRGRFATRATDEANDDIHAPAVAPIALNDDDALRAAIERAMGSRINRSIF